MMGALILSHRLTSSPFADCRGRWLASPPGRNLPTDRPKASNRRGRMSILI
jgi:hypothetical protein